MNPNPQHHPKTATFTKSERLKSRSLITRLFAEGKSKLIYPFRIVWYTTTLDSTTSFNVKKSKYTGQIYPVKFGVSVSKRHFSNATDRNRIKRQIRATYRLQKHFLYQAIDQKNPQTTATEREVLVVMFIYIAKKKLDYAFLFNKMEACLRFLSR